MYCCVPAYVMAVCLFVRAIKCVAMFAVASPHSFECCLLRDFGFFGEISRSGCTSQSGRSLPTLALILLLTCYMNNMCYS